MRAENVPAALRERLGAEATLALVDVLDQARAEQKGEMIAEVAEQFERVLVREMGALRADVSKAEAGIRHDMGLMESRLRQDMSGMESALLQNMAKIESGLRQDMGAVRVELFKWSFLFWVGQVLALAGFFAVALLTRATAGAGAARW